MKRHGRAPDEATTIRSRELARRLGEVKDKAGLNGNKIARLMGTSESYMSRILCGHIMPTRVEVAAFLAHCGVVGSAGDGILDLCDPRHDQTVLRLGDGEQWTAYSAYAVDASSVADYQPATIPVIAQTSSYTDEWVANIRNRFDAEMIRKPARSVAEIDVLPRVEVILNECCLLTSVGDSLVMYEQLRHLLDLSSDRGFVVRVLARDQRPCLPIPAGFSLIEFSSGQKLVYYDELTFGVFCDGSQDVAVHSAVVERLKLVALGEIESRRLIRSIAAQYGKMVEAPPSGQEP